MQPKFIARDVTSNSFQYIWSRSHLSSQMWQLSEVIYTLERLLVMKLIYIFTPSLSTAWRHQLRMQSLNSALTCWHGLVPLGAVKIHRPKESTSTNNIEPDCPTFITKTSKWISDNCILQFYHILTGKWQRINFTLGYGFGVITLLGVADDAHRLEVQLATFQCT